MPSANKTPNYNLTQYSNNGSDKISALKDYNTDMSKIDVALNDNANGLATKEDKSAHAVDVTAINASLNLKENRTDHVADVSSINSTIATKADREYTDAALSKKADITSLDQKTLKSSFDGTVIVIGDSISYGEYSDHKFNGNIGGGWQYFARNFLNKTSDSWYSEAASNSGFNKPGNGVVNSFNFLQQAQDAVNHFKNNSDSVSLVIVAGGINDVFDNPTPSDLTIIRANVISTFNTLRAGFANAKIFGIPFMFGTGRDGVTFNPWCFNHQTNGYDVYTTIVDAMKYSGYEIINGAWTWLSFMHVENDGIHPSDDGYEIIAKNIIQNVNNTTKCITNIYAVSDTNNTLFSNVDMNVSFDGTIFTINYVFNHAKNDIEAFTNLGTYMHKCYYHRYAQKNIKNRYITLLRFNDANWTIGEAKLGYISPDNNIGATFKINAGESIMLEVTHSIYPLE